VGAVRELPLQLPGCTGTSGAMAWESRRLAPTKLPHPTGDPPGRPYIAGGGRFVCATRISVRCPGTAAPCPDRAPMLRNNA
jgi:hypothetical protein